MPVSRLIAGVLMVAAVGLCAGVAFSADNQTKARSQDIQLLHANSQGGHIPQAAKPQLRTLQPSGGASQFRAKTLTSQARPLSQAGQPSENALKSAGRSEEAGPGLHLSQQQTTPPQMPPQGAASSRQKASDPLAPLNHKILNLNAEVDGKAFHPVASGWTTVVPKPARQCIHRFFDNVAVVPRFTNAVFQLKLKDAGGELARFGVNSTIGIAGLFDLGDRWFGIKERDNDFGKTLAAWGMPGGWFVVMPVAGPVNIRNALGHFIDGALDPMNYLMPGSAQIYGVFAHSIEGLNQRAEELDKFEGVPLQSARFQPGVLDSPYLYDAVRANFLQKEQRKEQRSVPAIVAATAGAAVAEAAAGGAGQAGAAAIGKAASEGATVGQ